MKYFVSVIDDPSTSVTAQEPGQPDAFLERLQADGSFVFAAGLAEPGTATVVDNREGTPVMTDGPFLESKEYLGGFYVIEAPDLDAALRIAADASQHCDRRVEVRPFDALSA